MQTIDYPELARLSRMLDERKPYVELIDGVPVPKVSSKTRHSLLQLEFAVWLRTWAGERGIVGTEWRLWLVPTGERRSSLVPDVAYVAKERMAPLGRDAYEMPPFSPDVAVEIRSRGDRPGTIRRKVELYLAHGARLVLDIDPATRTIVAHDATSVRSFGDGDRFEHSAVAGLTFETGELFDAVERSR